MSSSCGELIARIDGGFAAWLLGPPITTTALEICYADGERNIKRLAAALAGLHARARQHEARRGGAEDLVDARTLEAFRDEIDRRLAERRVGRRP